MPRSSGPPRSLSAAGRGGAGRGGRGAGPARRGRHSAGRGAGTSGAGQSGRAGAAMGKVQLFEIRLGDSRVVYSPGEPLAGTVTVRLSGSLQYRGEPAACRALPCPRGHTAGRISRGGLRGLPWPRGSVGMVPGSGRVPFPGSGAAPSRAGRG